MLKRSPSLFDPADTALSIVSKDVTTCQDTTPLKEVVALFEAGFRKIPVTTNGRFTGLMTIVDLLDYCGAGNRYQEFLKHDDPLAVPVRTLMHAQAHTFSVSTPLEEVVAQFKASGRGSHPVLKNGRPVGMLSHWDLLPLVPRTVGVPVRQVMIRRPTHAKETYPLFDVAKMMVKGGYRRLPVTRWGILTGIATPYDILAFLQKQGGIQALRTEKSLISAAMKTPVVTVDPDDDLGQAVLVMRTSGVGGLPVVEDQELLGIITESDIIHTTF